MGGWEKGECGPGEREVAEALIERWRWRMCDVSWYMRCLKIILLDTHHLSV
jgi:hypothetical protein